MIHYLKVFVYVKVEKRKVLIVLLICIFLNLKICNYFRICTYIYYFFFPLHNQFFGSTQDKNFLYISMFFLEFGM